MNELGTQEGKSAFMPCLLHKNFEDSNVFLYILLDFYPLQGRKTKVHEKSEAAHFSDVMMGTGHAIFVCTLYRYNMYLINAYYILERHQISD